MRIPALQLLFATVPLLACPGSAAPSPQRVRELFKNLKTGDFTSFYALFRPDSTWNTIGFGVRNKEQMITVFEQINCLLGNPPLKIETDVIISQGREGPYTTVQAHVPNGIIGTNGVQYNQTYLWLIKWQGEKIVSNVEYLNDFLAADLFGQNLGNC
ncbi:hypothetical protein HJFPF1_04308 [Paramyrothecium foliicola]|nr:hypothetical protein HJFPF1_04308 [Paramyrothecium foliicola]